ncbi:hypothetical protein FRB94_000815 [Tulasnella sp. JGI-2019a]|nr:hypothetical protein FRB94_000815 [Tulasnella sp. JGI-2019a]
MGAKYEKDDPLWLAIKPAANETPEQAAIRIKRETEAKVISDKIDETIRAEKESLKKKKIVRLLLLGQSESGKSTTIKQFQLLYSSNAFQNERMSWRLVIQLNLVKSVRRILEAVIAADNAPQPKSPESNRSPIVLSDDKWDTSAAQWGTDSSGVAYPRMSLDTMSTRSSISLDTCDTNDFSDYKVRLMPLLRAEQVLTERLAAPDSKDYRGDALGGREGYNHLSWTTHGNDQEVFVRSGHVWKQPNGDASNMDEPSKILYKAREDMMNLWSNPIVQEILRQEKINLSESSGFFLNDMERITSSNYVPTDNDILNARLKTVGVVEHCFQLPTSGDKSLDWRIYDVGGSRSQRATWAPFFDNVQAIIFLAPVSVFDQVLAEDANVNRLEDSLILWKDLCKNPILQKVPLVLFLNKCDLLRRKLASGVKLSTYMVSYSERPNDYDSILNYFKHKFDAIRKKDSKLPEREFYVYATSVTDTHQTSAIITSARYGIAGQSSHLKPHIWSYYQHLRSEHDGNICIRAM